MDSRNPVQNDSRTVSRRATLAKVGTGAALLGGIGALTIGSQEASATVTMGELSMTGDEANVNDPPTRIDVAVSGEYAIISTTTPEKVETILQVEVDGLVDDLDMQVDFDQTSGTYLITADIFSNHNDISQGYFTPADPDSQKVTDVIVRVVCRGVIGGEIRAEAVVEDTVTVTINRDGMNVSVGGEGSVSVVV